MYFYVYVEFLPVGFVIFIIWYWRTFFTKPLFPNKKRYMFNQISNCLRLLSIQHFSWSFLWQSLCLTPLTVVIKQTYWRLVGYVMISDLFIVKESKSWLHCRFVLTTDSKLVWEYSYLVWSMKYYTKHQVYSTS